MHVELSGPNLLLESHERSSSIDQVLTAVARGCSNSAGRRSTSSGLMPWRASSATPVGFQPVKSELLLRLLICDLVGEKLTRQSVATLRDDIADLQTRLDEAERAADSLPHRRKYLLLASGFLRQLLDLNLEFVAELERELGSDER